MGVPLEAPLELPTDIQDSVRELRSDIHQGVEGDELASGLELESGAVARDPSPN
jgi:hypothetical protein